MSRFIEILEAHSREVTIRTIPSILGEMRSRLDAEASHLDLHFPYFLERAAPASGQKSYVDYDCSFQAELNGSGLDFVLSVFVPVTSLCPCSRDISDYGAHNQRGQIRVSLRKEPDEKGVPRLFWLEELVSISERSASSPVYSLLKRPDERAVTMEAYENPVFVEDMVRNIGVELREHPEVTWFHVRAVNHESIHNHNAFAEILWSQQDR
jgi:GTP cyclohydrolase I